jgi:hypothetical protein
MLSFGHGSGFMNQGTLSPAPGGNQNGIREIVEIVTKQGRFRLPVRKTISLGDFSKNKR